MGKAIKIPMMLQALVIDRPVTPKTPMVSPAPAPAPAPATKGTTVSPAPAAMSTTATKGGTSTTLSSTVASTVASTTASPTLSPAPTPTPAPASSGSTVLEPGVHLSWALPDCLMRASVAETDAGTTSAGDAVFNDLPDTWLIVRFNAPVAGAKRTYRAWVLDAWKGTAQPVSSWKSNVSSAVAGLKLTPIGFMNASGDIVAPPFPTSRPTSLPGCGPEAFSGFYPLARDRFGFCDPVDDGAVGPLSYLVCGWYSQVARDPLYAAGSDTNRLDLLERLELEMDGVLLVALDGTMLPPGTLPPGAVLPPDHMVLHGMVADVKVAGVGGSLQPTQSPLPDPVNVDLTLGDSASDAFSGLIAELDERRWILRILQSKGFRGLQTIDAVGRIQADLHSQGFTARTSLNLKESRKALADTPAWKAALDYLTATDKSLFTAQTAQMDKAVMEKTQVDAGKTASANTSTAPSTSGTGKTNTETSPALKSVLTSPSTLQGMNAGGQPVGDRSRYFAANPPVLMFSNAGRSYRYGHDGRMHPEGLLSCRIQGSNVVSVGISTKVNGVVYNATVLPGDLFVAGPELASLDGAVQELIREAPLLDPTSAPQARAILLAGKPATDPTLITGLEQAWKVETTFWWLSALPTVNSAEVAGYSRITGNLPSPLSISPWADPWGTFYLDYAGRFAASSGPISQSWSLQAVEHVAAIGGKGNTSTLATPVPFQGRVLVSDGAPRALAAGLRRLTNDPDLKGALGSTVDELNAQADQLDALNVVSCELTGLDPALRSAGLAVRAGALVLDSVTLVDAFGRTVSLDPNRLKVPADAMQTVNFSGNPVSTGRGVLMPPRLLKPSRLDFRFLQSNNDGQLATTTQGPVCGWLVPDFIDRSLEVFDETGRSLGQLKLDPSDPVGFYWEPAPGLEGLSAERMAPSLANANLKRVVQLLLDAGQRNRGGQKPPVLAGLLALIDAVRGTVDRKGDSEEFLALLMGTPIAVVRARLSIEAEPSPEEQVRAAVLARGGSSVAMPAAPAQPVFPGGLKARLGVLEQLDDGLLGYVLDDDITALQTPVPGAVRISSAGLGISSDLSGLAGLAPGAMVEVAPGQARNLTLLMTPGSGVHGTVGALPQKKLDLTREWQKVGLERLAPTFAFGPLLVDPAQLRLPVPGQERFEWEWVSRSRLPSGVDGWTEAEVQRSDGSAILPSAPVVVQEGWLKLVRE